MTLPTARVFVPGDAAAVSVGADEVAAAFEAAGAQVVRNGSRGHALARAAGRARHRRRPRRLRQRDPRRRRPRCSRARPTDIGVVDEHPWLTSQRRVSFARVGVVDPASIADYEAHGGWAGLRRALSLSAAEVVQEVTDSGLRGRGGAGFPAGVKWKTVLEAPSDLKFVACNFDEGDSGTFADRMVVEGDPFTLIEGMTIAAHAVGASEGYVYVRSEYPHAIAALRRAVDAAYTHGYLGQDVLGSGLTFDLHVRVGAGAYICGEESSMLESLEGRRGEVRAKPPIPAIKGLWGRPTAVNNVLTLCAVPMIMADGGAAYAELGTGRSRGTQVFQLAGNIKQGGIVELPFGVSLRELVEEYGGGTPVRPSGAGGAGRRPARRLRAGDRLRRTHGLRGARRGRRDARARRHRGLRRDRRHGPDGALRDGVLLDRVVRQVHAVPGGVHARRRDHRPDHRRTGRARPTWCCSTTSARP